VTVDDRVFFAWKGKLAFAKVKPGKNGVSEIWPILLEKAYAKLFGSFPNIVSGHPCDAIAHLTNSLAHYYSFNDEDVKKMYTSGELW